MKKILLSIIYFIALLSFFPGLATAEKISSFDVEIVAKKSGLMNVTERIVYDFEDLERHGIFRFIPLYSNVGELYRIIKIDNVAIERDGEKEEFETTKEKAEISFKIGDKDKIITGPHEYKISYTVENGVGSNYEDHDEIYWNATGNDWDVVIDKASLSLTTDFGVAPNKAACFTRSGDLSAQFCTFPDKYNPITTTEALLPGDGLTAVYAFPKNTFPPSVLSKELPKTMSERIGDFIVRNILLIYLAINTLLPLLLIFWYNKKKNKKRFGPPVVSFDLPKDESGKRLAPAIAGTIDTATLQRDDVVATLFDLAIRKYLRFEDEKVPKKLGIFGKDKKQKVIKLKDADDGLNPFEKELYARLFKSGDEVYAQDLKKDFYKTYQDMEKSVFESLVEKKYFVKNPKVQRGFLLVFGFITLFTGNIILAIVLFVLSKKLIGRTALGDEIDFKIDGLKLFLKSMNRNYKWQTEKLITIEQMIPYAMALGYIDEFMGQLKIIKPDYNPSWYHGYSGSFYTNYSGFYSSVNSNITTSAPSSSSGFSGGSSGGGGGGGGGGSW